MDASTAASSPAPGAFGAEHGAVEEPALRRALRRLVPGRYRPMIAGAVRGAVNRGDAVACPCCERRYRRFIRHRGRPHARCPGCGSLERHRMLWLYLAERTDLLSAPRSLLHLAPEHSFARRLARLPQLDYVTADIDSPLATDKADIMDMPYADELFDAVLCSHVLEHVEDDRVALAEILRVLRPGGFAILMSPIDFRQATTLEDPSVATPEDRHRFYGQSDHARLYGRDFAERVAAAGFSVRADDYLDEVSPDLVALHGLRREDDDVFGEENIFLCRKPAAA